MPSPTARISDPFSPAPHHEGSSIHARQPILSGIVIGVASLAPHYFLPPAASLAFAAVLIALIAGA